MLCARCKIDKDSSEYHASDKSYCKSCRAVIGREWIKRNPDKHRKRLLKYRKANREKIRSDYKNWYAQNGRKQDKIKLKAHYLLNSAVKLGRVVKPSVCSHCTRTIKIEGHHDDYFKPLEVIWLCNRCHRTIHSGY